MNRLKGFKYGLMKHLADATSVSTLATPIKAITDQLAGISDLESLESRAKMTALNYLGLVQLLKLRDYSKKKLGISKTKNKILHYVHDIGFVMGVSVPIQTAVYISSGVTDWKEIVSTIAGSLLVTGLLAGPYCQGVDIFREITRIKKSKNTPNYFKRLSNNARKKWAVGFVVGSLALTGALYSIIPNKNPEVQYKNSNIEKLVNEETQTIYSEKIIEKF